MDDSSVLVLALQLTALTCIAGSILLYLVRKIGRGPHDVSPVSSRSVLVTSVGTQLGLESCLHLARSGFRVFAGCPQGPDSPAGRLLRWKLKEMEADGVQHNGVVVLTLDCTREDSLHDALLEIRRHLPAGENGLWGVLNTVGSAMKGRIELQESATWEHMFRQNIVATLRTVRALLPLLRLTKGRLVTIGLTAECWGDERGAVAYSAARHGVAGGLASLRAELAPCPVSILVADLPNIRAEPLYKPVRPRTEDSAGLANYRGDTLPDYLLRDLERLLLVSHPKERYQVKPHRGVFSTIPAIFGAHARKTSQLTV